MTTEVLGALSFIDQPSAGGIGVLLNYANTPGFGTDTAANRPAAGNAGQLFVDTTNLIIQRDNGTTWDTLSFVPSYSGTANQINLISDVFSIADNPIIPGTARLRLPGGTTAQRPATPVAGDIRYNSTLGLNEKYTGTYWGAFGLVLQQVTGNISSTTGSTQLPWDNTQPLITEGIQIWTTTFTPISATSRIVIEYTMSVATSTANRVATTPVFFGATVIGATANQLATANVPFNMTIRLVYAPGNTNTVTVSARCGLNGTGTLSINQANGNNLAGIAVTQYSITEIE